jgi:hypothetical protein
MYSYLYLALLTDIPVSTGAYACFPLKTLYASNRASAAHMWVVFALYKRMVSDVRMNPREVCDEQSWVVDSMYWPPKSVGEQTKL